MKRWKIQRIESRGKGYVSAYVPDHPSADRRGRVYLHRIVVENRIGRLLRSDEIVHHKDGDPTNNRLSNLEIKKAGEHAREHSWARAAIAGVKCAFCGEPVVRPMRDIKTERTFCSKSHSSKFYAHERGFSEIPHGAPAGYKRGCRCDTCRAGHAQRVRAWRKKNSL